jgi:diaminohydroxyphosphoribosylaminopyrimidine deaminase/5-amino-6-(5-phosphoribosylamino)uracil reductase
MNDEFYMKKAIGLARRGLGRTSPNPMVGALIVKGDEVIGQGYHRIYGGNHAEIDAIANATGDISGATLYVTLEPCCHLMKKTPPCLDTILEQNLQKVVIGTLDPNPRVNGRSVKTLEEHGIETRVGVLVNECNELNEAYFKYIRTGIPYVTLKFAQTVDGRIASAGGDARWISSEPSLKYVHKLRSYHDAILVGTGTVLMDDPELTVRLVKGRNPVRVIIDSTLRTPLNSRVLKEQGTARTIVAATSDADRKKIMSLTKKGVEVLTIKADSVGKVDLKDLLRRLGEMNISSVLIEGGAAVITSVIHQNIADKYIVIIAPKITGAGINSVGDLGIKDIEHSIKLSVIRTFRSGEDLVIEARPETGKC